MTGPREPWGVFAISGIGRELLPNRFAGVRSSFHTVRQGPFAPLPLPFIAAGRTPVPQVTGRVHREVGRCPGTKR